MRAYYNTKAIIYGIRYIQAPVAQLTADPHFYFAGCLWLYIRKMKGFKPIVRWYLCNCYCCVKIPLQHISARLFFSITFWREQKKSQSIKIQTKQKTEHCSVVESKVDFHRKTIDWSSIVFPIFFSFFCTKIGTIVFCFANWSDLLWGKILIIK